MNQNDIIDFVTSLSDAVAVTASESTGAPREAWGDTFFFYDPEGDPANRRVPFATIVVSDYEGDTVSNLNRPGVFRLNVAAGREHFEQLIGYPPAEHAEHSEEFDYTTCDRFLPHPVYATYGGWVAVLNPGERTGDQVRTLLSDAHAVTMRRHQRRSE